MTADLPKSTEPGWLRTPPTDSAEIAQRYDDWAATYDEDLVNQWNYDAPFVVARMLADIFGRDGRPFGAVLDLGCGTGLTGVALVEQGFTTIDGVDLSEVSLLVAQARTIYRNAIRHDFNSGAVPFSDDCFAAAICVGVMSYALDPLTVIRDLCRVVESNGSVIFTHRTDLWESQDLGEQLLSMERSRELLDVVWTEPQRYMPGNPEYEDLRIRYVTLTVA